MNWYLKVMKNYVGFSGRARRKEYWMFYLFNLIFAGIAAILDNVLGITIENYGYGPIFCLYYLIILLPALAVSVRRLHDVGKSGWFLLISFVPLIGAIWLLVLMVTEGQSGKNKYGVSPK
jgi:uncharacterized membrane protein YhaH (DUF805 family)